MTDEQFDILTTKVLAGEASAEESARLVALLAQDRRRRAEFDELKVAWTALREYGPLMRSLEPPPIPFPEHRMAELQSAVRKHLSHRATELQSNRSAGLQPASDDQNRKADCKSALRAVRKAPAGGRDSNALRGRARERPDSLSILDLLRQWFQSPGMLAGAVAAAVLVCGLLFFVQQRGDSETLAYLVTDQGRPEIVRHGNPLPLAATVALQKNDRISLVAGDAVRVLTPAGSLPLQGPQHLRAEHLYALVEAGRASAPRPASKSAATVQTALFGSLKQLHKTPMLAVMRDTQGIALYSPRDATRSLTPLILWKAEPGKTYDITITDEFDRRTPAWQVRGVVPPVNFAEIEAWKDRPLAKEGLYRILIQEAGNPLAVCEDTFQTRKEAEATRSADHRAGLPTPSPTEKIARAFDLLNSRMPCPGDALAELLALPPEFADQPLVLRLKLAAFAQLGLHEEYDEVAARLTLESTEGH